MKDMEKHSKHQREQELHFKIVNRRNKLLGLWVAERLGLSGKDAQDYALTVVAADFDEPGDADVRRKVLGDLKAKGVDLPETELSSVMERLMHTAHDQVMAEAEAAAQGD